MPGAGLFRLVVPSPRRAPGIDLQPGFQPAAGRLTSRLIGDELIGIVTSGRATIRSALHLRREFPSMQPQDLSDELLTLIHNGAAPLDRRDHRAYYNHITVWLDESPLLTPRTLADVIKEVQGKLLRPPLSA